MGRHILKVFIVLAMCGLSSTAWAVGSSGFEIATNTAKSLGRANAVVADPAEPAAVAFNPAGLTSLDGNQVSMSYTAIAVTTEYDSASGVGSETANHPVAHVPSVFASISTPSPKLKLGLGVNAPFGLETQYASDGNFKYLGSYNQIKTVAYNTSLGYEIKEGLSIGAGVSYLDTSLKQVGKINSNLITLLNTGFNLGIPDAPYELEANGGGWGYNLGLQINHYDKHYLGLFYRSQVRANLDGEFSTHDLQGPVMPLVFGGSSLNTDAETDITLPGSVTLGYKYRINEKWDVEADITWTRWSSFDRVDIDFSQSNAVLAAFEPVEEQFDDVWSLNLGTTYKINDVWSMSAGYYYYQMAASKDYYSNAIPDGDRHAFAVGLEYAKNRYYVALSYIFLYLPDHSINNNVGATSNVSIDGSYESVAHMATVDIGYKF